MSAGPLDLEMLLSRRSRSDRKSEGHLQYRIYLRGRPRSE